MREREGERERGRERGGRERAEKFLDVNSTHTYKIILIATSKGTER